MRQLHAKRVFCLLTHSTGFQILGHVKTVLVLFLGWFLFSANVSTRGIVGSIIAVCGIMAYSISSDSTDSGQTGQVPLEQLQEAEPSCVVKVVRAEIEHNVS